jgi:hypothetical protein
MFAFIDSGVDHVALHLRLSPELSSSLGFSVRLEPYESWSTQTPMEVDETLTCGELSKLPWSTMKLDDSASGGCKDYSTCVKNGTCKRFTKTS